MMMNAESNDYNDTSSTSNAIRRQRKDEIPDVIYIRMNAPQSCLLDNDDKVDQQSWLEEDFGEWSVASSHLSDDWSGSGFSVGSDSTPTFAPSLSHQDSFKLLAKGILVMLLAIMWGGTLLASPTATTSAKAPLLPTQDRSLAIDLGLNLPTHAKTDIQSSFNGSIGVPHQQRGVLLHHQ